MSNAERTLPLAKRIGRIVSWVVGTILLFDAAGMILIIPEARIAGFGFLVAGLLILPPTAAYVREKAQPPSWAPPVAAFVAVVAAMGVQAALTPGEAPSAARKAATEDEVPASTLEADASGYGGFVKQLVSKRLLDPESAQFSDGMAYRTEKRLAFCGRVNAKNRFGGYVGAQPYVVAADGQVYLGASATSEVVLPECQGRESATFRIW